MGEAIKFYALSWSFTLLLLVPTQLVDNKGNRAARFEVNDNILLQKMEDNSFLTFFAINKWKNGFPIN